MIKTKSTGDPISSRDGLRLFVTRYWRRGHRREGCDEWIPDSLLACYVNFVWGVEFSVGEFCCVCLTVR